MNVLKEWKEKENLNDRFISHVMETEWGSSILIMEKRGKAFGRIYWYNDDDTTVYLDILSVDVDIRKQGIGTELQKIREEIGIQLGAKSSCLWTKKDSWVYDWYQRRGYVYLSEYEGEENSAWMKKELILS